MIGLGKAITTLEAVENLLMRIGAALVLLCVSGIVFDVFANLLFGRSIIWVNEFSEYMLLYVAFLGAAWVLRENAHIKVDIIEKAVSPRVLDILDAFSIFIGGVASSFFLWFSFFYTLDVWEREITSLTALQVPQVYVVVIMPIGCAVLLLEFVRRFSLAVGRCFEIGND